MERSKVLVLCLVLFVLSAGMSIAEVVTLASSDYPPYSGADLQNNGALIEIVTAAFREEGYLVNVVFLPWKRSLIMTIEGKYDGIVPIAWQEQREKALLFSSPLAPYKLSLIRRVGSSVSEEVTMRDLMKYKIGVGRGYIIPPALEHVKDKLNLIEVTAYEQGLRMLMAGRIDLMLAESEVVRNLIGTKYPEFSGKLGPVKSVNFASKYQYVGFSKKKIGAEKLLGAFDRGLNKAVAAGIVDSILERYGIRNNGSHPPL